MSALRNPVPTAPTAEDMSVAREASRRFAALVKRRASRTGKAGARVTLQFQDVADEMTIPRLAIPLFQSILAEIANGNPVSVVAGNAELSSQQAADAIGVSRPFLIKLLEQGAIPHRKVGRHRRVRHDDLMRYKRQIDAARQKTLDELTAEAQTLGLGY